MKLINKQELAKYDDEEYIWYACYGSNINYRRFMYYINGDEKGEFSTVNGCTDKSKPVEERSYIFNCPIYFAGESKRWGGGMAFLDYENSGKSYGKIYMIKMNQFKSILEEEQECKLYDAILLVDGIENLPVFTFTAKHKLQDILNQPSKRYVEVIKEGLLKLYDELDNEQIEKYLKN